jgi:hypothetical protein
MGVEEVENMPTILDDYKPHMIEEQATLSQKSIDFVKIMMLQEELERERERLYQELNGKEKKEAFEVLSKQFNIPDFISVRDVSEILGITPQMVRRHCSDGKLKSHQTLEGSGKWRIDAEQFMDKPNWDKFIEKRAKLKKQSIKIADEVLKYLDDEE